MRSTIRCVSAGSSLGLPISYDLRLRQSVLAARTWLARGRLRTRSSGVPPPIAAPRAPERGPFVFSTPLPTRHLRLEPLPPGPDHVAVPRVQLHQQRLASGPCRGDERAPTAAEHASLGGVPDRALDEGYQFHRRVLLA